MSSLSCGHDAGDAGVQVCAHLLEQPESGFVQHFTGAGLGYVLLCKPCAADPSASRDDLAQVCGGCVARLYDQGYQDGRSGQPAILERSSDLALAHVKLAPAALAGQTILDVQPVVASAQSLWVLLTRAGLFELDGSSGAARLLMPLPSSELDLDEAVELVLSHDGRLAAIVNSGGSHGIVLDLLARAPTLRLLRDDYYPHVSSFPVAFFTLDDRTLLVHGTAWNRLDISDPYTGELLTPRGPTEYRHGEERPPHYLDYFHCSLSVSPDQQWIAEDGWIWHPVGSVMSWSLRRWARENLWESEDGPTRRELCWRSYSWNNPLCWIDERTLAVWGYGEDDDWIIDAVRIFDVVSGSEQRWFAGPEVAPRGAWGGRPLPAPAAGWLAFDGYLFSRSEAWGFAVWDVESGERLLLDRSFTPWRYHHGCREFLSPQPDGSFLLSRLVETDAHERR